MSHPDPAVGPDRSLRRPPAPEPTAEDSTDRVWRRVLWTMPSGLYLLGSRAGGTRNLMTLNWASQLALRPRLVGVSVELGALTHRLVADGGVFALSILDRDDRAVVRRFVKPAVDDPAAATLGGHAVTSDVTGAPILASALAWVDCELREQVRLGSHDLFVGEVVGAGFTAGEDRSVLRMEDTRMNYGG